MNPQETADPKKSENRLLFIAAIIPLGVMLFSLIAHSRTNLIFNDKDEGTTLSAQKSEALAKNMHSWQDLSWSEKEKAVFLCITFLRSQKNCAILKSPQHYVTRINQLVRQDPSIKEKDLMTILTGLAVIEYDFFNGVNADEQAMRMLGPKLFEENKRTREEESRKIAPSR
ncbi:MAG TPA: hypothetical protein PLO78_03180 [Candidatus Omnitrophota bacterium]|nr:hypothetical protein [Candidatus Omnitrophota bacterium]